MIGDASNTQTPDGKALPAPDGSPSDDLYEILQVSPRATLAVIQAAYRVLARNYHPDVNAGPSSTGSMRRLNAAYTVLADPTRRAQYDVQRPVSPWRGAVRSGGRVRRRPVLSSRVPTEAGSHSGRLLVGRVAVTVLIAAFVVMFVLILWTAIDAIDDRPTPTYRPRAETTENLAPSISNFIPSKP
jgi:hypothetical protein